jgi:hypothetical protein
MKTISVFIPILRILETKTICTESNFWNLCVVDEVINELIEQRNYKDTQLNNCLDILSLRQVLNNCGYLNSEQLMIYFQNSPSHILHYLRAYFTGFRWHHINITIEERNIIVNCGGHQL